MATTLENLLTDLGEAAFAELIEAAERILYDRYTDRIHRTAIALAWPELFAPEEIGRLSLAAMVARRDGALLCGHSTSLPSAQARARWAGFRPQSVRWEV